MESYMDEVQYSKKKLLVPLIVLMLCAVSLVGVGYAYNSSLTSESNVVGDEHSSIDLDSGTDTSIMFGAGDIGITVYQKTVYTGTDKTTAVQGEVSGSASASVVYTDTKIASDDANVKITITASDASVWTYINSIKFTDTAASGNAAITVTGTAGTAAASSTGTVALDANGESTVAYSITAALTTAFTSAAGISGTTSSAVADLINGCTFTVLIEYV